jgi:hypothetical protein
MEERHTRNRKNVKSADNISIKQTLVAVKRRSRHRGTLACPVKSVENLTGDPLPAPLKFSKKRSEANLTGESLDPFLQLSWRRTLIIYC